MGRPLGSKNQEVIEEIKEVQIRKFDSNRIPLCFECNHREDMHHVWKEIQRIENYKERSGDIVQRIVVDRLKDFSKDKPCQHACKCIEFK